MKFGKSKRNIKIYRKDIMHFKIKGVPRIYAPRNALPKKEKELPITRFIF